MTSAIAATSSTSRGSRSSVTIGSPVSSRASTRISRPFEPRPWNAYGDERGLNAPPRSTVAPAAATARAVSRVCSRVSTVHGPAISPKKPSPIRRPRTSMTVESGVRPRATRGYARSSCDPGASIDASLVLRTTLADRSRDNLAMRIFSGIQPTGAKHLGNYVGGFRQYAQTQEQGEAFFCIVDLHSVSVEHDPRELRERTLDVL